MKFYHFITHCIESNGKNSNTDIVNRNLQNISNVLNEQNEHFNIFEIIVTLIIQKQHFLNLIGKIKRTFIFSDRIFDSEILTYEQIADIKEHLLELYSRKELILHYHNLLDFRFTQGSIVTTHDSIIYTLKIPILNSLEFSLFQRLAIINNTNNTEIITIPWILIKPPMELLAKRCQLIFDNQYVCYQITTEKIKPITITADKPLILAYRLHDDLTLISSNYPITIKYDDNETIIHGSHLIQGKHLQIQGHSFTEDLGELKLPEVILPTIIKNDHLNFEPLEKATLPTISTPTLPNYNTHFHMSIINIIVLTLIIFVVIYLVHRKQMKKRQPAKPTNDEDVIELRQGGVI